MAKNKSILYLFVSCAALPALYACTSLKSPEPPNINRSTFSTKGKATKTVATPQGSMQVYDPTKDPEIIAMFEYLQTLGYKKKNALRDPKLKKYQQFLDEIQLIQKQDLLRLGCKQSTNNTCRKKLNIISNKVPDQCQLRDFGETQLNICETSNVVINTQDPYLDDPLGDNLYKCESPFYQIGVDVKSQTERREELMAYFRSSCIIFEDNVYGSELK